MKLGTAISTTTAILLVYLFSVGFDTDYSVIMSLFVLTNGAFLWMAYRILSSEKPNKKSFKEYFYEDWDYKRNTSDS